MKELKENIKKAIENYDADCSVIDFTAAFIEIVKEEYGSHVFDLVKDKIDSEFLNAKIKNNEKN